MRRQIKIDGVRIDYQETGQGRPLILLHGIGATQDLWEKNREALSRSYRVITPDLPGCGLSAKPLFFDYSFLHLAEVMEKFVLNFAQGEEKVILGGNSMGGGICLAIAPRMQDILSHLILIGSMCYPQPIPQGFQLARAPVLGDLVMLVAFGKWTVRLVMEEALLDTALLTKEWVNRFARPTRSLFWRLAQLKTLRGLIPADIPAVLASYKQIKTPTLVVWGEEDIITPVGMTDELARDLKNCWVELIPLCGHVPHFEKPDFVNKLILDFLAGK